MLLRNEVIYQFSGLSLQGWNLAANLVRDVQACNFGDMTLWLVDCDDISLGNLKLLSVDRYVLNGFGPELADYCVQLNGKPIATDSSHCLVKYICCSARLKNTAMTVINLKLWQTAEICALPKVFFHVFFYWEPWAPAHWWQIHSVQSRLTLRDPMYSSMSSLPILHCS